MRNIIQEFEQYEEGRQLKKEILPKSFFYVSYPLGKEDVFGDHQLKFSQKVASRFFGCSIINLLEDKDFLNQSLFSRLQEIVMTILQSIQAKLDKTTVCIGYEQDPFIEFYFSISEQENEYDLVIDVMEIVNKWKACRVSDYDESGNLCRVVVRVGEGLVV